MGEKDNIKSSFLAFIFSTCSKFHMQLTAGSTRKISVIALAPFAVERFLESKVHIDMLPDPGTPVVPLAPGGPRIPGSPCDPFGPFIPCGPRSPLGPIAPCCPVTP